MVQHLSIRVPWHDNGWNGTVCKNPEQNQLCRILKNIAEKKDDETEVKNAGNNIGCESDFNPPCVSESGLFMSDSPAKMTADHPYTFHDKFNHIRKTDVKIKPYTFLGRPFRWTLKKDNQGKTLPNKIYFTQYDESKEIKLKYSWINNGDNQKNIFDYFYSDVKKDETILVAYGPTVPFTETPGKVIAGIGMLTFLGKLGEYDYKEDDPKNGKAYLWERQLGHSIRQSRENGFLFPFKEIQIFLKKHPKQDPDELIVKIPEEYFEEFSYVTEHLSHDALIQVLNKTINVLKKYIEIDLSSGDGADWDTCIDWCKEKLEEVWNDRGTYPGLGAVLHALRIPYGFDVAKVIKSHYTDDELWESLPSALRNLSNILPENFKPLADEISDTIIEDFEFDYEENRALFELLSRITLSLNQAKLILDKENIKNIYYADYLTDIHKKDLNNAIIENPYILYEKTRLLEQKYQFGIGQIDYALFLNEIVRDNFPKIPAPSLVINTDDKRRLRAITIAILESRANQGHTLELVETIAEEVNEFRSDVENINSNIRSKTLVRQESYFKEELTKQTVTICNGDEKEENFSYQLNRYVKIDELIRNFIEERIKNEIPLDDDWKGFLDEVLKNEEWSGEKCEKLSREEKVEAIEKMAKSQISVLTGGAGTGKTTTIVALCKNRSIENEGILLLAPTGKARVVLSQKLSEQGIKHQAMTLFQYLLKSDHCDFHTWSYYLSDKKDSMTPTPNTIVIDESSMLSEEMFGAFVEAAQSAKRIIFVGDPNQLPPIGAGKPFWELVNFLKESNNRLHYANLIYSNRQKTGETSPQNENEIINEDCGDRIDVELSKFFTDNQTKEGDMNNIFDRIKKYSLNIEFKHFKDSTDLKSKLTETIFEISNLNNVYTGKIKGMKNAEDIDGFDFSIGGKINGDWMNFNNAELIDSWQILTPYKNDQTTGSATINRIIQQKYRKKGKYGTYGKKFTKNPIGNDAIVYGEKVINTRNQDRKNNGLKGYPKDYCQQYIANGEIGIVTGLGLKGYKDKVHNVIFSSQMDYTYGYYSNINEESTDLELAYALTVHKAQGSGFKATIVVINEPENGPCTFLSRELIYTALTRHSEKIYILYNKKPRELEKYTHTEFSELARRKTNLININPKITKYESEYYDYNLIHITVKGEKVRSKSEVIIADLSDSLSKNLDSKKFLPNNLSSEIDIVKKIILEGESQYIEFKETLCWDVREKRQNNNLILSALKTIIGFLNSKGGILLIGVDDEGNIKGLNNEIKKVHKKKIDNFLKFWKNHQKEKIGPKYYDYIETSIVEIDDKIVYKVDCKPSPIDCYLKDKNGEKFFVRINATTDELKGKELVDYVTSHFNRN